jgi:hypothetical protein
MPNSYSKTTGYITYLFYYLPSWRHTVFLLCIKRLPRNKTAVNTDRLIHYKTVYSRLQIRPETEKRRNKTGQTKWYYIRDYVDRITNQCTRIITRCKVWASVYAGLCVCVRSRVQMNSQKETLLKWITKMRFLKYYVKHRELGAEKYFVTEKSHMK